MHTQDFCKLSGLQVHKQRLQHLDNLLNDPESSLDDVYNAMTMG